MPTHLQFGAGNIGRSFVAQLFSAAGYDVVFIDVVDELVNQFNAQGHYRVMIVDTVSETRWVEHVRAVNGRNVDRVVEEIAEADTAATAVGQGALRFLYPTIAKGLQLRYARYGLRPLDIILAENLRNAADIVRAEIQKQLPADFPLDAMLGLVETSIGKMVPLMTEAQRAEDPLWVFAEAYSDLILDAKAFKNPIPAVPGLSPKQNMKAYVDRKLFIHNLGHAAAAYLGLLHDPSLLYIWQAVEVPEVRAAAEAAMWESAHALIAAYPDDFTTENLGAHIADLLHRFENRALGDTIFRVGRDLPRKLSRDDRIIGSLRMDQAHGVASPATARVAAAAFQFTATDEKGQPAPMDAQLLQEYATEGLEAILTRVSSLDMHDPAEKGIAEAIQQAITELESKRVGIL